MQQASTNPIAVSNLRASLFQWKRYILIPMDARHVGENNLDKNQETQEPRQ